MFRALCATLLTVALAATSFGQVTSTTYYAWESSSLTAAPPATQVLVGELEITQYSPPNDFSSADVWSQVATGFGIRGFANGSCINFVSYMGHISKAQYLSSATDKILFQARDAIKFIDYVVIESLGPTGEVTDSTVYNVDDLTVTDFSQDPVNGTTTVGIAMQNGDEGYIRSPRYAVRIKLFNSKMPGDTDGDGDCDFQDFLTLSANFGDDQNVTWEDGDFDEDGEVGFSDFLLLSTFYSDPDPANAEPWNN